MFEQRALLDDVTMLVIGEPDVPVAKHIGDAARRAWAEDRTDYGPNGGIPQLRQAIQDKLHRENRMDVDLEQVWVTVGATQALFTAMTLVLSPGDEVLVPDPGYTTFTMNAHIIGATRCRTSCRRRTGSRPTWRPWRRGSPTARAPSSSTPRPTRSARCSASRRCGTCWRWQRSGTTSG